jgi:uncharacterized membrane protein YfcA
MSCVLLAAQPRLARWVAKRGDRSAGGPDVTLAVQGGVFVAAVYGSYFGAGLGVLLLGVLGVFLDDTLQRLNGLKSVISFVVNVVGVLIFLVTGQVVWLYAVILLVTSYAGGVLGARVARLLSPSILRASVVSLGTVVGIVLIARA